jgi:hypothetical protein
VNTKREIPLSIDRCKRVKGRVRNERVKGIQGLNEVEKENIELTKGRE